jgi:hypothetical protein
MLSGLHGVAAQLATAERKIQTWVHVQCLVVSMPLVCIVLLTAVKHVSRAVKPNIQCFTPSSVFCLCLFRVSCSSAYAIAVSRLVQ